MFILIVWECVLLYNGSICSFVYIRFHGSSSTKWYNKMAAYERNNGQKYKNYGGKK